MTPRLYIGTAGLSVWYSDDLGETLRRLRSRGHGAHWEDAKLPGELQSSAWCVATNPADPQLIFVATALGQYFRSADGGENWTALPRRLTETRALAWVPD